MRGTVVVVLLAALLQGCSAGVTLHHPLGGFPDDPSIVRARVTAIDARLGTMRVQTFLVNGAERNVGETVWIDEETRFTNSGGGRNLRSWEDLTGAEVVITGWYRDDRYYADEVDVVKFVPMP